MAQIVLGLGSSHGPTIRTKPEGWARLGEKDMEDPRFDFSAELRRAGPEMAAEIAIERQRERYDACQRGVATLTRVLADARPDVIVMLSNLHGDIPDNRQQIFGVYVGGQQAEAHALRTEPALADHLFRGLNDEGFDVHRCADLGTTARLGDEVTFVHEVYATSGSTPIVPFMISRYLPNQASPRRVHALGLALRRVIESWDGDKRVAVMASGGLSHQILDEDLDRSVVKALLEKDVETLCSIPRDRLNRGPGTPEILNWIAVSACMGSTPMTLVDYVPCYRSLAGTGHGVTFGYWG